LRKNFVILRPHQNIWRIERAARAAVLIDAGQYFAAVRQALLKAQSTVFIVGWDIDSRTRLVGESGKADDGFPEELAPFLSALIGQRPKLVVYVLVWDYSLLYALERELFPVVSLHWRTPRRLRFCLDDDLPLGASHHQKIVVVDDSVAFCGGLDLTVRRWDTREHKPADPQRVDPAHIPYPPFHDVQAVVDGQAAVALGKLARERWARGACERARPIRPRGDPWPKDIRPDLTDINVGIARTSPASQERGDVREVEALFLDSIDQAERTIYIETQYFTSARFNDRLVARMREKPDLEVVVVLPKNAHSWLEQQTMHAGLLRSMHALTTAGLAARARLLYPQVTQDDRALDTMVHSKVMVIDDVLMRVGSANLNNRSLGLDTECDLAFEGQTPEHRTTIQRIRNRLIGHHCGVTAEEVAETLAQTGSLIETALTLRKGGHALVPLDVGGDKPVQLSQVESFADPERPIEMPAFVEGFVGKRPPSRRLGRVLKLITVALIVVGLTLAWRYTPLSALLDSQVIAATFAEIADMRSAPIVVIAVFVFGGLLVFPVLLLIAATAATFGPWLGFAYAASGALASAIVTYGVGALIGARTLDSVMGPRLNRVRRSIARRGVLAVAAVRMVPVAPFTLVNLVAGASRIPLFDYILGTMIGMAPGLVLMSALGYQIFSIITHPTLTNVLLLLLAVVAWISLTIAVQALLIRSRRFRA
jgi:phospholipase D1/2